ncbi:MAG: hypothetical protein KME55_19565 [Nostoc indistinguendum CM1-VF10]|jgi:hypothetical protein|nr:hypothetical protein [Nostoc indistinguendum CM1-VF10]
MLNVDLEYAMVAAWLGEVANIEAAIAGVTSAKKRLTVLMYFFIQLFVFPFTMLGLEICHAYLLPY